MLRINTLKTKEFFIKPILVFLIFKELTEPETLFLWEKKVSYEFSLDLFLRNLILILGSIFSGNTHDGKTWYDGSIQMFFFKLLNLLLKIIINQNK